jgi:hypothetical protein
MMIATQAPQQIAMYSNVSVANVTPKHAASIQTVQHQQTSVTPQQDYANTVTQTPLASVNLIRPVKRTLHVWKMYARKMTNVTL